MPVTHDQAGAPWSPGPPALARCVRLDREQFADRHWGRTPLLSRAADLPAGFDDLLTLADVDELLSRRGLRTPFLRLAKDGHIVPTGRFTRGGGAGASVADQVADDRVLQLLVDGSTVVLQALHRVWPPLVDFSTRLAVELGHPVQVNAYVTPPQSRGFAAHYDVHDVFVLQVAGEKHWTVHEPVLEAPLRDQPWTDRRAGVAARAAGDPCVDTVLRPGDALYLPRGYLHSARALGGVSAHLTVGVHPVTRYALAQAALAVAAADPALRASLPLGLDLADERSMAAELAVTVQALVDRLRATEPGDLDRVAGDLRADVWPQTRPEPLGPLTVSAALAELDKDTVVRARLGVRFVVRDAGDPGDVVLLDLGDRRLELPAGSAEAVRVALGGPPVTVDALPGLSPDDRIELVRRLMREGVVVPARR